MRNRNWYLFIITVIFCLFKSFRLNLMLMALLWSIEYLISWENKNKKSTMLSCSRENRCVLLLLTLTFVMTLTMWYENCLLICSQRQVLVSVVNLCVSVCLVGRQETLVFVVCRSVYPQILMCSWCVICICSDTQTRWCMSMCVCLLVSSAVYTLIDLEYENCNICELACYR